MLFFVTVHLYYMYRTCNSDVVSMLSALLKQPKDALLLLLYDGEQLSSLSHSSSNNTVLNMLISLIINHQHSASLFLCKPSFFFSQMHLSHFELLETDSIEWFNLILAVHCFTAKRNKLFYL